MLFRMIIRGLCSYMKQAILNNKRCCNQFKLNDALKGLRELADFGEMRGEYLLDLFSSNEGLHINIGIV